MFYDYSNDSDFLKSIAQQENISVHNSIFLPYKKIIKGFKCPKCKRVAQISHTYSIKKYPEGNYTRIYFLKVCCSSMKLEVIKKIRYSFPNYEDYPIFNHEEI